MTVAAPRNAGREDIVARFFDMLGVDRPATVSDRNNAIAVFLMGALPAVAGSAISFMLGAFFVWALISLARGRIEFRMTRSDRLLAWTFTAFAALIVLTGLIAENPLGVFRSTIWLLPFLSLWAIIPRLRADENSDYLLFYILGAAVGCLGALVFACVESVLLGARRPEGGAGNAAIFAGMSLCLAGIAGLGIDAQKRGHRVLAAVAVLAGLTAVVLSLTRGVGILIPLILLLVVVYAPGKWRSALLRPVALIPLVGMALVVFGNWDMIAGRLWQMTVDEFREILGSGYSANIGERIRLWSAAWSAFLEAPLLGHGIQNRMASLAPYLAGDGHPIGGFSHPHNGYLTFAVDGGLVVLASLLALLAMPVVVAWRTPRDAAWRRRLFLALVLVCAYASIGLTQILFKHEIMDSFYIYTVILLAASIPDTGKGRTQADAAAPAGRAGDS